ncbi:MAG: hypothetical protein R2707_16265 [Acidimicrobiales bacterium]
MTSTVNPTPLLDGPRRGIVVAVIMLVLGLMAVDGLLTWIEASDADDIVEQIVAQNPERYPTGVGANCGICQPEDRATIAANTDGSRLDRDTVTTKMWLAVIGLVAAVALTIASGPGSSRTVLMLTIVIAGAAFFVPLIFYSDVIDIATTAHGG